MSKTLSYKGQLPPTTQERIKLSTIKGKRGYRIVKFDIITNTPAGSGTDEQVMKIFKTSQEGAVSAEVNFTDSDLLAVAFYQETGAGDAISKTITFDNEVFNQDIYITCADGGGGTKPCNYYIELETMDLSDVESTQLTLKSLRDIASQ
tara:strand:+ start:1270 stop:1716 length:447 start_codon:yes stop_codon:yes gene_type:complete